MPRSVPSTKTALKRKRRPRASYKRELTVAEEGLTPLDFLLRVMRNAKNPPAIRMEAAKAAAPYVHPKLAQISTQAGQAVTIIVEGGLPKMPGTETIMPKLDGPVIDGVAEEIIE